jgi:hypothetical protein
MDPVTFTVIMVALAVGGPAKKEGEGEEDPFAAGEGKDKLAVPSSDGSSSVRASVMSTEEQQEAYGFAGWPRARARMFQQAPQFYGR